MNTTEYKSVKTLVTQVGIFVKDEQLCGRLYADLTDAMEVCNWFIASMRDLGAELTRDELESYLIKIEVNLLSHLSFHLDSLRRDMPMMLEAIGTPDDSQFQ